MNLPAHGIGRTSLLDGILYAAVVTAGFFLVATTWWFQDDWHFLANAMGIAPRGAGLARFVSYEAYWRLFMPVFGVSSIGWAASRLVIHLVNALLVRAITARVTGQPASGFAVGLLFAASPLAFECLYWASGVVDLLGTMFALLAVLLWLRGGRRIGMAVVVAAIVAAFSKETAVAVVVLLAVHAADRRQASTRELVLVIVTIAAAAAALVSLQADMGRSGDYALSLAAVPRNLAIYGYWLVAPPSLLKSVAIHSSWSVVIGAAVWIAWGAVGLVLHRRGRGLPAAVGLMAVMVLLPAMLVGDHAVPRYVYAAVPAFLIAVVSAVGGVERIGAPQRIAAAFLAAVFAWTATAYHVDSRWPDGRPLHRYVVKREISAMAMRVIGRRPPGAVGGVALVVSPRANREEVALLQDAIGGELGIRVLFGPDTQVRWLSTPEDAGLTASVFLVEGMTMRPLDSSVR